MLCVVFAVIIVILLAVICVMYVQISNILSGIDRMLDAAIDNTFSETSFTEKKLSRLEAKMYRYLSAGSTALAQVNTEKDGIKTLISDISHQTKTPIANILLYAQLLKEALDFDDGTRQIVSQIEAQTEKLSFLIASLIKTSRLENGIINVIPEENSVAKLVQSIDYKRIADEKGVSYSTDIASDMTAVFDFKWTLEAVSNIVDNAIKYTSSGGTVAVRAKEYEMFVCIDITDSGIGIPEEDTARIFKRFYRSPAVYQEKGVGIGLYLARRIIEKEGGYIRVRSRVGEGSVFSVFLPKQGTM